MVSSPLFRISGSLIKPTRESLLDYCAYCLVVIALIGIARIWIGGSGLTEGCPVEFISSEDFPELGTQNKSSSTTNAVATLTTWNTSTVRFSILEDLVRQDDEQVKVRRNQGLATYLNGRKIKCAKYYQSVFAYILLVESSILLFSGLIWSKVPKVSHSIKKFSEILKLCGKSNWAKKALNLIGDRRHSGDAPTSQSLHSIASSESMTHNIRSFLDQLFHPDNDYRSKSKARLLYENVVVFCEQYSQSSSIWRTYIMKSLVQFFLWLTIFNINLVLFVILEFYIMCPEDNATGCDHDVFLRIIWFMSQTVLLIYALYNCKTLMWINEKSIMKRNFCCPSRCFGSYRLSYANGHSDRRMICRPYSFADNPPVYNDAALMLHLLEEAHPKLVPYFVVFMCPEWKEKLTSFPNPVIDSDTSSIAPMQMISGRPSVSVQIIDMPFPSETQPKKAASPKKKGRVTFFTSDKLPTQVENSAATPPENSKSPVIAAVSQSEKVEQDGGHCDTLLFVDSDETRALVRDDSSSENADLSNREDHESDASDTGLLIRG